MLSLIWLSFYLGMGLSSILNGEFTIGIMQILVSLVNVPFIISFFTK